MNNAVMASSAPAQATSLASILIPTAMQPLLVPTVSVAEIVPYRDLIESESGPQWLLGEVTWREHRIPLLSLEQLCGEATPERSSSSRIVVFNNTGVSDQLPFIAILASGIPKLIQVTPEDLNVSDNPARPFENMRVNLLGDEVVIPEVSSLEQVWLQWHQTGESV